MSARIAVVGSGWWATEAHLPALAANPDAELVAVVDPDPERRALAVEQFQAASTYASVEEMFAGVEADGAIVAVPHHLHHPLAAQLLDAGLHVLVEKPLTIDAADARDLVARAKAQSVELLVGYPWHYNDHTAAVRDAIAGGRIGKVEFVTCLFASIARQLYHGNPTTTTLRSATRCCGPSHRRTQTRPRPAAARARPSSPTPLRCCSG